MNMDTISLLNVTETKGKHQLYQPSQLEKNILSTVQSHLAIEGEGRERHLGGPGLVVAHDVRDAGLPQELLDGAEAGTVREPAGVVELADALLQRHRVVHDRRQLERVQDLRVATRINLCSVGEGPIAKKCECTHVVPHDLHTV